MGNARVGKDLFAQRIEETHRFIQIGLADPMKRFCGEVFEFTDEQLYGDQRDLPDKRYVRGEVSSFAETEDARTLATLDRSIHFEDAMPMPSEKELRNIYLTPRYALQTLGTEWGRNCYNDIWINYGIQAAKKLLSDPRLHYHPELGVYEKVNPTRRAGVVFSDLRFRNEFDAVRKAGGLLIRIYRPGFEGRNLAGLKNHPSEEEQRSISDSEFDLIVRNPEGLENYHQVIDEVMAKVIGGK